MRLQDEKKKDAIFEATIKLVNKVGFVSASVAKIAKEANVSPATIYIYHKNKEDLLISVFIDVKRRLGSATLKGFDESSPLKESFRKVWSNLFKFIAQHREYFQYTEQFMNSPYNELVDYTKIPSSLHPFLAALKSGTQKGIIKKVDPDILAAFIFHPIMILSNPRVTQNTKMTRKRIEAAFEMAWDAIKL